MHPAFFYRPGLGLSGPELCSARLDGLVVEIGGSYMPADTVESAGARATSVAALVGPGLAASGPTAAWIHGAGDAAPARVHVHRAGSRRVRVPPDALVVLHDTPLGAEEVMSIDDVAVTTPLRTLCDLALGVERHPEYRTWAAELAVVSPGLRARAVDEISSRRRLPGRRRALTLLETLPGVQDEVTR